MIVLDTSGLLAAIDGSERHHVAAAAALRAAQPPRLLTPFVLAELDYLLRTRVSRTAALDLLKEVSAVAYQLEPLDSNDIAAAIEVLERYPDLDLGLTDASLVVLAERHGASDILTLDERHLRAVRNSRGRPFRLLPLDSSA